MQFLTPLTDKTVGSVPRVSQPPPKFTKVMRGKASKNNIKKFLRAREFAKEKNFIMTPLPNPVVRGIGKRSADASHNEAVRVLNDYRLPPGIIVFPTHKKENEPGPSTSGSKSAEKDKAIQIVGLTSNEQLPRTSELSNALLSPNEPVTDLDRILIDIDEHIDAVEAEAPLLPVLNNDDLAEFLIFNS